LNPTFALRIPGNSPAAKAAAVILAAIPTLAVWTALAVLIALFGMHQVTLHTNWDLLPDWLWYYRGDPQLHRWLVKGYEFGGIPVVFGVLLLVWDGKKEKSLHGDARFADARDVDKAGLFGERGIMCGMVDGRYVRAPVTTHVELEAPTRSGKGVGVIIPTQLDWDGSEIVVDPKGENYDRTAGFLAAHGVEVYRVDFLNESGRTHRFNPLSYIDRDNDRAVIGELRKIAIDLFPAGKSENRYFSDKAQAAFIGVGAYIAATPELPFTLAEIYQQIIEGDPRSRLRKIVSDRATGDRPLSSGCVTAINDFTSAGEKSFPDIIGSVTAKFTVFLDPLIVNATSESDFDLAMLRQKKMAIFLVAQTDDIPTLSTLFTMIFQQSMRLARQQGEYNKAGRHRVLLLLDEFFNLGPMPTLMASVTDIASYGFNMLFVLQNRGQLTEVDRSKNILGNCDVQICYTPNMYEDAKEISERLGTHGATAVSKSKAMGWFGKKNNSQSESQQARPLMLPQEVRKMPASEILIFARGVDPIKARKIIYYESKDFQPRLLKAPELPFARRKAGTSLLTAPKVGSPVAISPAPVLTDEQIDGQAEISVDALRFDREHDVFAAIARGEDGETATVGWFRNSLGIDPPRMAA